MAKKCPRCGSPMRTCGKVRLGTSGGMRVVYICKKDHYKTIG